MAIKVALLLSLAVASASPILDYDPVIRKEPGPRYQYMQRSDGSLHLVDLWLKASNLAEAARFDPDRQNVYHLFTRQNPTISQPLLQGNSGLIGLTNFNANRRTIVLVHGWFGDAFATINNVLVPVFLAAEDVNVIVVDWSNGASNVNYFTSVVNTFNSGVSVANFINWLNSVTGASPSHYHLLGHSLGGHQVGIIGRHVNGNIAYITALDAALPGWITNDDKFRPDDGAYTEVIHTNAGLLGYLGTQGHVDFYPNGGINMPGCDSQQCDHNRCIYYLAESITSGGFRGTRCLTFAGAMAGQCYLLGRLNMGGLVPKTGSSGIYYFQTNAAPPFSMG